MTTLKSLMAATAIIALVGAWPLIASAQATQDPHHPAGAPGEQSTAPTQMPGGSGMMGDRMGMSGGRGGMMDMMGMMTGQGGMSGSGACGPGMAGAATIDRVEGRIAFLRAELKITEAQTSAWNTFADTLRANAKKLGEMRASMMQQAQAGQVPTMTKRLEMQEQWLTARLEGTRAMKSAFDKLYGALSEEQKTTADELFAPHMGMGAAANMPMGGPRQ